MSPNRREMDQLTLSKQEGELIESILTSGPQEILGSQEVQELASSLNADESVLVPGLLERVREFGQARRRAQRQIVEAPEESDGLQEPRILG